MGGSSLEERGWGSVRSRAAFVRAFCSTMSRLEGAFGSPDGRTPCEEVYGEEPSSDGVRADCEGLTGKWGADTVTLEV